MGQIRLPQFRLRSLQLCIVFIAAACAVAVTDSEILRLGVVTGAFLVLLTGVVAAAVGRGQTRAFGVGFSVFGWPYFAIALWPFVYYANDGSLDRNFFVTTDLLYSIHDRLYSMTTGATAARPPSTYERNISWRSFELAGHSMFAVLVAVLGGFIASWFYERQMRDTKSGE